MKSRFPRAFSLIELLAVVVILGILASAAALSYRKVIERQYYTESENLIYTIYSGQRSYHFAKGVYVNNPTSSAEWRSIHMDDPNVGSRLPVTFSVTASGMGDSATFTATAMRNGGACDTDTITITHLRVLAGSWAGCSAL